MRQRARTQYTAELERNAAARECAYAVLAWMDTPSTSGLLEVHRCGRLFRAAELQVTLTRAESTR